MKNKLDFENKDRALAVNNLAEHGDAVSDRLRAGVIDVFPINLKQGQPDARLFFNGLGLGAPSVET